MAEHTGGELIARMLQAEGVSKVFGIIDGTYFGFYSALHRLGIEIVTPRHETSAAHMAGAYARLSGRLGVCMASNGPGVANVLPGLVVEQAEGNRVLCVSSARRTGLSYPERPGAYQSFDQCGVVSAFAKWSRAAPSYERIPELMRAALRACWEGRPGVVHLDVPENIMNGAFKGEPALWAPSEYRRASAPQPAPEDDERAAGNAAACRHQREGRVAGVEQLVRRAAVGRDEHLVLVVARPSWLRVVRHRHCLRNIETPLVHRQDERCQLPRFHPPSPGRLRPRRSRAALTGGSRAGSPAARGWCRHRSGRPGLAARGPGSLSTSRWSASRSTRCVCPSPVDRSLHAIPVSRGQYPGLRRCPQPPALATPCTVRNRWKLRSHVDRPHRSLANGASAG